MKNIAVEVRNIVKRFGEVVAVDHVSLQIQDGEFFSLLGPSGCGKTTTLRMIAGFEQPTEGEVFIDGQPSGGISAYERNTNMVFQNYALFPHMTVADNVAFGLEIKRVPKTNRKRRVTEALEMVRLPGLENRKPKQLSGGQQQRVALAAGNTVIIKPSDHTPLTTLRLAEIVFDHFPPGVVNVLTGRGNRVGDVLVEHPDEPVIAFTGSTGHRLAQSKASYSRVFPRQIGYLVRSRRRPDRHWFVELFCPKPRSPGRGHRRRWSSIVARCNVPLAYSGC